MKDRSIALRIALCLLMALLCVAPLLSMHCISPCCADRSVDCCATASVTSATCDARGTQTVPWIERRVENRNAASLAVIPVAETTSAPGAISHPALLRLTSDPPLGGRATPVPLRI